MNYTVEVTLRTARPLTEETLQAVAAVGGAAAGNPGGRRVETTLTVNAPDIPRAIAEGIQIIKRRVSGSVIAAGAMTTREADRSIAARNSAN